MATSNNAFGVVTGSISLFEAAAAATTARKEGCQCIDASPFLSSLTVKRRSCQITTATTKDRGVMLTSSGPCVPPTYGSGGCLRHDLIHDPRCSGATNANGDGGGGDLSYCMRPWCYVDARECMRSSERAHRSANFARDSDGEDLFYSYTTCDPSVDDWLRVQPTLSLGGRTIRAAVPRFMRPFMYKRNLEDNGLVATEDHEYYDNLGSEYYNNSIPYEGAIIDYFDSLMGIADGDFNIEYTYGSRASRRVHEASTFTAAVQDIEDGLVDAAVGPFWITGPRLQMTSFTVPLYYERTMLVVKRPVKKKSLNDEFNKVFEPFKLDVWGLIIFFILLTALLSVWFSDRHALARKRYPGNNKSADNPKHLRKSVYARLLLDEVLKKGLNFCSAGIEQDVGASLPHKILLFGFGFFILVVVSAYVANMAAFLTHSVSADVLTMEAAVEKRLKICVYQALEAELKAAWPGASFVFSSLEHTGLFEDYDAGNCDLLAVPHTRLTPSRALERGLCKRGLVFTNSLVMENPVAIPIQPEFAPGLSYWMYQGEKYHSISLEKSMKKYDASIYDLEISTADYDADDSMPPITVDNLLAPIIFFMICVVLAIVVQIFHQRTLSKGLRSMTGRTSQLCDNALPYSKHDNEKMVPRSQPNGRLRSTAAGSITLTGTSVPDVNPENGGLATSDEAQPDGSTAHGLEPNDDGSLAASVGNATARFHQLVKTGALDDFFDCYNELKTQKEN